MPPPRRSYATPEETFGIAKRPLNDWFDFAASGLERTGPAFSADLEDASFRNQQRELEREKLRQQMDSEQAASAFMKRAAGQSPTGLMQMIADDPAILGSSNYSNIQDWVGQRAELEKQKQVQQPFSNGVLAPALMKSMKPADQLRFQKYLGEGLDTVTAFDRMEQEDRVAAKREQYRPLAVEAAKLGGDPAEIRRIIETSDDPEIDLAVYQRQFAKSGKGVTVDEVGEITKILGAIEQAEMLGDDGKDTVDYLKSMLKSKREKVIPSPSTGETKDIPPPPLGDKPIAPVATPTPLRAPLSPFEEQQQKQSATTSARQQAIKETWTGAKDRAVSSLMPDSGIEPQRLVSLAQKAILGEPVEGTTQQEQQLADKISQFALRALQGEQVQVGTEAGEGGVVPVLQSPGFALMEQFGLDPNEVIELPGTGVFGSTKRLPAWKVMDLRLKEIAQPLEQKRKAESTMTPDVMSSYEKLKAQTMGLPVQEQ